MDRNKIYIIIIAFLLFLLGFVNIYDPHKNQTTDTNYESINSGKYFRLVYIGSSSCGFSNNDEMHKQIQSIKKILKDSLSQKDIKLITTGISVDRDPFVGYHFLEKTKPYDEIITGSNWYNLGADRYIWDHFSGLDATPQVLLLSNTFNNTGTGGNMGVIERKEDLLERYVGANEINDLDEKLNSEADDFLSDLSKSL